MLLRWSDLSIAAGGMNKKAGFGPLFLCVIQLPQRLFSIQGSCRSKDEIGCDTKPRSGS
jgi:hypothetical protein